MRRFQDFRGLSSGGFTLIELLVVMAIIAIMIGLLMPAINSAVVLSRKFATASVIESLGTACESFKKDFGCYPPSSKNDTAFDTNRQYLPKSTAVSGADDTYGYNCLMWCLCGQTGKGFGTGWQTTNNLPLSGGAASKQYGPYYQPETGGSITSVSDAFKGYIYYYRFKPSLSGAIAGSTASGGYELNDNPTGNSNDCSAGFADPTAFQRLAAYTDVTNQKRWRRTDFLLISAGADRFYGYVLTSGQNAGKPANQNDTDVTCDDVCNFPFD